MTIPLYQIDAFAQAPFQGNPAAICPLESWLPDEILQAIAEENRLSETAFFVRSGDRYHLRWFTPTNEVDLCGHATLAAAHVLFETICQNDDQIAFDSLSGPLQVMREGDELTLDFPSRPGEPCQTPLALTEGLGLEPVECYQARDYMAVLENEGQILALQPDFRRLRELNSLGVIVTAPGTKVDFVSRFFAPKYGIDEDPVTGSAHCTLAPYWSGRFGKSRLEAKQLSARTGHLRCRISEDRVFISGRTILYLKGTIYL